MIILRNLRPTHCIRYGVKAIQNRHLNYRQTTRSFLSDRDRVRDFIALLAPQERQFLYDELHRLQQNVKQDTNSDNNCVTYPSFQELRKVFFNQSLPFIGFGFLDNLIMIIAGDYIDATIGVTLGISTMAAAGLGNALSDIAGIGSAYYVEQLATRIGVKSPDLSLAQLQMTRTRWSIQLGRAFGITLGCIIGMFPLLFLPTKADKSGDNKSR
ncbi:transmembrane protein 65-like [Oppia nitens]|uniref:transmembrane protein 65-like n=1 Tax=Oppia nitens TaxID=1686743 RepID=UPI0023DBDA74|nr:transmembrane protein 65-like [Oppia nitens]